MHLKTVTLGGLIQHLAQRNKAPIQFVTQLRWLFIQRGINMGSDAEPHRNDVEEAFRLQNALCQEIAQFSRHLALACQQLSKLEQLNAVEPAELLRMRAAIKRYSATIQNAKGDIAKLALREIAPKLGAKVNFRR